MVEIVCLLTQNFLSGFWTQFLYTETKRTMMNITSSLA